MPLTELLANCLAARYVVELGRLTTPGTPREGTRPTGETEGNGGCDFEVLRKLCRDVLALRRLDLAGQRLRIEREAADRLLRADEKEQAQERLAAADAAVEREDRHVDDLIWRKEHQNDPAYADCCDPLSPEEEAYVNEGAESEEEEQSAGEPEATGAALEDQPVPAQDGSGQSNKGELTKIKANKGKLSLPKAESMPKAGAKAVRDAKILAGTLKEGE